MNPLCVFFSKNILVSSSTVTPRKRPAVQTMTHRTSSLPRMSSQPSSTNNSPNTSPKMPRAAERRPSLGGGDEKHSQTKIIDCFGLQRCGFTGTSAFTEIIFLVSTFQDTLLLLFTLLQTRSMPVRGKAGLSTYFRGVDKKLAHLILNEIIDSGPSVRFNHIGKPLWSCLRKSPYVSFVYSCVRFFFVYLELCW